MECNAGVYVFEGLQLWPALDRLSTANAQGEYYLTDVVALLTGPVEAVVARTPTRCWGSTTAASWPRPRRSSGAAPSRRSCSAGVTVEDPATTYVDVQVVVGRDSVHSRR